MRDFNSEYKDLHASIYRRNLFRLLDNFQIVNGGHFVFAIPWDTPPQLERSLKSSALAYSLELKSVDYAIKKYGDSLKVGEYNLKDELLNEILGLVRDEVSRVATWITSIDKNTEILGAAAAGNALIRLQSSFRSAGLLIRLGYIFEASAICRLILEQLAWSYNIYELNDESLFQASSTKSISNLKKLLPEAGVAYGFLSKFTHLDSDLIGQYTSFEQNGTTIHLSIDRVVLDWAWMLLLLTDYYSVVTEFILRNEIPTLTVIKRDQQNNFSVIPDRPLKERIEHYRTVIKKQRATQ